MTRQKAKARANGRNTNSGGGLLLELNCTVGRDVAGKSMVPGGMSSSWTGPNSFKTLNRPDHICDDSLADRRRTVG